MPFTVYLEDIEFDEEAGDFKTGPENYSYEKPALGDANGAAEIFKDQRSGLLGRLTGNAVPSYLKLSDEDKETLRVFLPALKDAGVRRCTLTYDGGNDEGFGALESCLDGDGNRIALEDILANDGFLKAVEPHMTANLAVNRQPVFRMDDASRDIARLARDYLDYEVPVILVSILLGRGYGTGEYELYGRADLDLDAMTITDDPNAPYPHGTSI